MGLLVKVSLSLSISFNFIRFLSSFFPHGFMIQSIAFDCALCLLVDGDDCESNPCALSGDQSAECVDLVGDYQCICSNYHRVVEYANHEVCECKFPVLD